MGVAANNNMIHLAKDSKLWKDIHDCDTEHYVSVTCFLDFIGEGYNSRASLFKRNKPPPSSYTQLMFDYGHKNEIKAKALFDRQYPGYLLSEEAMKDISVVKNDLLGTPDGFLYSEEEGFGILEVKCPYGNQYGKEQIIETRFEENPKRWKHWLQLQLYLFITGFNYGILAYYYPYGGTNGEQVLIITKVKKDEKIAESLKIEENVSLFFDIQGATDFRIQNKRVKKVNHGITTERISKGIIQRVSLQV